MNPAMASFDPSVAPKRSNSGREIIYVQNQRIIGSSHTVGDFVTSTQALAQQTMPDDIRRALDSLRAYSYRELSHWLKIDRAGEIGAIPRTLRSSSIPDHRNRLSVASHASSAASSVFSAPSNRASVASSNTAYSQFSDPGTANNNNNNHHHNRINFTVPVPPIPRQHQQPGASEITISRKKSSIALDSSPTTKNSSKAQIMSTTAARPSPRQSQTELEAKKKYFCTSCNKGFARKYDWKVHEQRYHEQQVQYPCPDCNVVLHAETLFKSHHRDSHGCQDCPHAKSIAKDVEAQRRRTAWGCGFCGELLDEWEKRCDHVSAHYDEGLKRDNWDHSKVIVALLKQPDVDEAWKTLLISKHGSLPNPPIAMRWSKDATGRSHGENSHQLQDLLEFGACGRDAAHIAQLAYELGLRTNVEGVNAVGPEVDMKPSPTTSDQPQDSVMTSPTMPVNTNNGNATFTAGTMPNAPVNFDAATSGAQQLPTPESRMSSVGPVPMNTWSNYQDSSMLFQQLPFHHTSMPPMQPMQASYDKDLPPLPCDASEQSIQSGMHHQHFSSSDTMSFDNWSLVGSTIAEEPSMSASMFSEFH